jgi:hypothetical protein
MITLTAFCLLANVTEVCMLCKQKLQILFQVSQSTHFVSILICSWYDFHIEILKQATV